MKSTFSDIHSYTTTKDKLLVYYLLMDSLSPYSDAANSYDDNRSYMKERSHGSTGKTSNLPTTYDILAAPLLPVRADGKKGKTSNLLLPVRADGINHHTKKFTHSFFPRY